MGTVTCWPQIGAPSSLLCADWGTINACRAEEETIELEEEAEDDVEDEPTEAAFLLVRRHISEKMPLEGKPIEVIIELYNAGSRYVQVGPLGWLHVRPPAAAGVHGQAVLGVA